MINGKSATMGDWLRQGYQRACCHTIRCTPSDFRPTSFFPSGHSIFSSSSKTSTGHLRVRKATRSYLVALILSAFQSWRHPPQGLRRRRRHNVRSNNLEQKWIMTLGFRCVKDVAASVESPLVRLVTTFRGNSEMSGAFVTCQDGNSYNGLRFQCIQNIRAS